MPKLCFPGMLLVFLLADCAALPVTTISVARSPTATQTPFPAATRTFTPTVTSTAITSTPSLTVTSLPTVTAEPAGCQKPPDDYTRVDVNGWTVNARTMAMLAHAQELYGGELELTGHAITQGSYHDNGSASFGTHLGGGAVDLSVLRRGTYTVLWDDVEPLVHALRLAGLAAWLREYGELYADSPIHIHAIAIGDVELSSAAQGQLTGPAGYFRGYSGLTDENSSPTPDRHGGPILCQWMIDFGYQDLR
jgi:hypothetical protein